MSNKNLTEQLAQMSNQLSGQRKDTEKDLKAISNQKINTTQTKVCDSKKMPIKKT